MISTDPRGGRRPVYLLSPDADLGERLAAALARVGLGLERLTGATGLARVGEASDESVLILDTRALEAGQRIGKLLAALPRPPLLICIAHRQDVDLRLQAVRSGARACFLAPVDADLLAARLAALIGAGQARHRVLVVDDEPIAAAFSAGVLERAGMETRVVTEPLQTLDAIDAFQPDLVLMDLHMSGASGMELTGLIREHQGYARLPVVFLSSEMDPSLQVAALRVGGDDFLAKPVAAERLVAVVRERISRAYQASWTSGAPEGWDPITGLPTRDRLLRRLERQIAAAPESISGAGLIYVAPRVPAASPRGRAACAAIARLLRREAQANELVASCGDGALGLLAMRADTAALEALRGKLALAIRAETGVPADLGLARFSPPPDDALSLLARAQAACARSAEKGPGSEGASGRGLVGGARVRLEAVAMLIEAALAGGTGLELLYQPIVALRGRPGERYEASLRLRAPDGEYVPRRELVEAARSHALLADLDRWVAERALDALQGGRSAHPGLRLFLPQTLAVVASPDWIPWLRGQVSERELIRCRPVLQFDAGDLAAEPDLLAERIRALHRLGIMICISRFDLEPVGLALMESLPVSFVRLSRRTLGLDTAELAPRVEALHRLGRQVIAAGIDDPADVPRVWSAGVDLIQGGFLQLPSPELGFDFGEAELG